MISGIFFGREQTGEHAARSALIQIFVATTAFILMMRVFPAGIVQNHTESKQKAYGSQSETGAPGDIFTSRDKKLQTVYFKQEHIYQITLYMQCKASLAHGEPESVLFRLYDDTFSCIYELEADSKKIEGKGCLRAYPDMDVDTALPYYYEILIAEDSKNEYRLPVADRTALAQTENSTLYIDGIINDAVSLIADFEYTSPLTALEIAARYALIMAAAFMLYAVILVFVRMYDKNLSQYSDLIGKYFRITAAVLSIIAALALFIYAVILNKFGGELWDRLFFAVGIIVMEAWVIGALWRVTRVIRPKKRSRMSARSKIWLVWRNYIQTVSFGLLFYTLCQYVNADRNFYQYTNTRWMLIFMAAAFLMNYSEKQFINWFSAIWLVLAAVGSALYCRSAGTDENTILLARLTCGVVAAWGLLILNIVLALVQSGAAEICNTLRKFLADTQQAVYAGLWILFSLMMYVYRFEKVWVFTATLPFAAYLFSRNTPSSKSRFLKNFSNGILLSFAMVTVFCLRHRPHHYWMLYRYGGMFHTVACTGMYLAVVFGAALARLYGKLKARRNMLLFCYAEYFVTACVTGFILLTMSRTAFLTTIVTVLAIVILTAVTYHKRIKKVMSELCVLAAVCMVSFPMVFTAVRMIPAVVNDPVRYEIEFQDKSFMIYEGDPIDSDKYMTVRRFFSTLFGRFQTQEKAQAERENKYRESALLAYTGDGLAGLDMRTAGSDEGSEYTKEEKRDISNGRFDIFKDYIAAIGFKGHPKMGPERADGEEYAHAHNSYLQAAYNFGIIAGVVFSAICALALWRAVTLFTVYKSRYNIFLVPFAMVTVFSFISLTEWAFHPCIPIGFCFLLMQVFLMRD